MAAAEDAPSSDAVIASILKRVLDSRIPFVIDSLLPQKACRALHRVYMTRLVALAGASSSPDGPRRSIWDTSSIRFIPVGRTMVGMITGRRESPEATRTRMERVADGGAGTGTGTAEGLVRYKFSGKDGSFLVLDAGQTAYYRMDGREVGVRGPAAVPLSPLSYIEVAFESASRHTLDPGEARALCVESKMSGRLLLVLEDQSEVILFEPGRYTFVLDEPFPPQATKDLIELLREFVRIAYDLVELLREFVRFALGDQA